jgi:hypothetical protein
MLAGLAASRAQQSEEASLQVEHSDCTFFGPKKDQFRLVGLSGEKLRRDGLSRLTNEVVAQLGAAPLSRNVTALDQQAEARGTIDRYLFEAMQAANVAPAERTNDFEFIRRVTLDLTGRIPKPERVQKFVADISPDRRASLVDELLASQEWVDRWTMYFGDLFQNTAFSNITSVQRYADGRNAFYQWIKTAVSENRPYNQVAADLIAAQGTNSYEPEQGQINWIVNGFVTNGPAQDAYDQQAANVAETFLGMSHMNCILCHNGRGHLDSLSLWGKTAARIEAWGLAAYMAKTALTRTRVDPSGGGPYYWRVADMPNRPDYALNTTTGNRPARCLNAQPLGANGRCSATGTVTPQYPFSGRQPAPGESYRAALAREITGDFQFARATVNYIWKEFFERGIVDPVNQFDPARLDPDHPPEEPWTLQPSNAPLLNALAQDFISSGYNLKTLMRQIANSEAYQLSARYKGEWNPAWEKLFARKLVRRLSAEEIHDAVAQSSNVLPSYNIPGIGRISWAMQLPELRGLPDGNAGRATQFLDSFLRGNRDDEDRRTDGSPIQALNLMNDAFVVSRIRATGSGENASLLQRSLAGTNEQLISNLFLVVLSRYPNDTEKSAATAALSSGNRTRGAENLLWSLYNKADFIFNY